MAMVPRLPKTHRHRVKNLASRTASFDEILQTASIMSAISTTTTGRALFVIGNLFYSAGSFIADFNHTHVLNPRWPPHARFHNGQTMSLGLMLAALSTYLAFRSAASPTEHKQNVWLAAVVGSLYCTAGLSAILYPGTDWVDPEFEVPVRAGQGYMFAVEVVLVWVAYAIEVRALNKQKAL